MEGHFDCLHILATVNNAATNTDMHIFLQINVFKFFRQMAGREIAGSYGNSMLNFLRNLHTVFHNGCTSLHSYQQRRRVPYSQQPLQHLLLLVLLIIAILTCVKWYLIVVLICILLRLVKLSTFKYLLVICIFSWAKCLFMSSAQLFFKQEKTFLIHVSGEFA